MRRAVKIILGIVAGLVLLVLIAFGLAQTGFGKRQILALIEDQLSDPPAHLEAQALEGLVPFDMTLIGAKLSDAKGVWLEADRLSLAWSPMALLGHQVKIETLVADRIAVLRSPVSPPSPPKTEPTKFEFPRLPVDIDLQRLAVDRLELGPEFLGTPAVFSIQAQAKLGDPADGLQADLALTRIDRDQDRVTLKLDYRPSADTLAIDAQAEEPQGGIITSLIGLPGQPKFTLSIAGSGPLNDWQAKGLAASDDLPLLDLTATSKGPTDDRAIAFSTKLHNLPMLPPDLAPLVEGGIAADGQLHIAALDQPIRIDSLKLETRAGTIAAQGTIDPGNAADLKLDLRIGDSAPFGTLIPPELQWSSVTAQAHLAGPIATPKLTFDGRVADLAFEGNRIGESDISLAATLDTENLRADAATLSLTASSIAIVDPKLQSLLTDGVAADFAGALDQNGTITADQLHLRIGTLALAASGSAAGWGVDAAHIKGRLDAGDLTPLLAIAGLQGHGKAAIDLSFDRTSDGLSAQLEATTSDASIGIAEADRLIGVSPKLSLNIRQDAAGLLTIDKAKLDGGAIALNVGGTMSADRQLDLKVDAKLADLGAVLPKAKGAVALNATITGSAEDPSAKLQLSSGSLKLDPLNIAGLQAAIDATNLISAPKATIDTKAQVNALPASLSTAIAVDPKTNQIGARQLQARLGATSVEGKLDIAGSLLNGDLTFASTALRELGALAGAELDGTAKGAVTLRAASGRQDATIKATVESLAVSGVRIAQADLDATAGDALGKDPRLDATLAASGIDAQGQQIDKLDAKVTGQASNLAVTANATGKTLAVVTQADIQATKDETRITLQTLDLTVNTIKAALQRPAEIALRGPTTTVTGLAIGSGGGTAELDATLAADSNQVSLTLKQLPTSLVEAVKPDLHLLGTLDGTLRLDGPKTAPRADLALKGKGLGVSGASAELADLDITGNWNAGQFQANGRVALAKSGALDFSAALPMAADPASGFPSVNPTSSLNATAKGEIDLGLANAFIPGGADHIAGKAAVDLSATGAIGQPVLAGKVAITEGRYDNQRYGTRLRQLTATLEGNGSKLRLVSLNAKTPGGGTLTGEGDLDFSGEMPVTISINMDKARVINAPNGTAVTNGSLQIKGTMQSEIALTGKVMIVKAEIRIPDRLPVDVEEIPVKEINLSPARQAKANALADAPPPKSIKIGLDLAVDAPEQIFVRGRGLDAEMGGTLKITGTADLPIITGALKLRRGDFDLLSRRLDFNRGIITFSGSEKIDPELDFAATSKLPEADVTVTVSGNASRPVIALTSSPALPQDEILARLLFGKASGALSPFEAVQLAQAMAQLTEIGGGGPGVLDKVRQGLGLDRLDVEAGEGGASSAPSLSAGRYVTRGVFVGAKQGATPGSSAATVEIEITPNIKVETDVGADSTGKAEVNLEWNY